LVVDDDDVLCSLMVCCEKLNNRSGGMFRSRR